MESLLSRAFCTKRFPFVLSVLRVYCCWLQLPTGWQEDPSVSFLGPKGDFAPEMAPDTKWWPAIICWEYSRLPVPATGDERVVETIRTELERITFS